MKTKLKISNSISISLYIAAYITILTFAIIYLIEYLVYKGIIPGSATMGGYLGLTVALILLSFGCIPLTGIILSSILFKKIEKGISYKELKIFGGLLIPFGFIFNGIVILVLSKNNKELFIK